MASLSHSPVRVARVALRCAERALPRYMSKFSRHDGCTFPQLAACLVLKDFWKTSLRGVRVQLADASDVRRVLHLPRVPSHSSLWRAEEALSEAQLERFTEETVRLALEAGVLPEGAGAQLSADSTGFTRSRAAHWASHRKPSRYWRARRRRRARGLRVARAKKRSRASWDFPKWSPAVDVATHLILAQLARRGPWPDVPDFAPLVLEANFLRPSHLVLADKGFECSDNLRLCEEGLGARAVVRVRRPGKGHQVKCRYRRALLQHLPAEYRLRNASESAFSAHKRRFGDLIARRTWTGCVRAVLLRGVLHNCALLLPAKGS